MAVTRDSTLDGADLYEPEYEAHMVRRKREPRIEVVEEPITGRIRIRVSDGERSIQRIFEDGHRKSAIEWANTGWQEQWAQAQDKTWTITWCPVQRWWKVTSTLGTDSVFDTQVEVMDWITAETLRHGSSSNKPRDKMTLDNKDAYGQW